MITGTWTFVAVYLLYGLAAVSVGVVVGIWFVARRNSANDVSDDSKQSAWNAELASQQALMASERLVDLTQKVVSDVNAHSTKVEAISVDLRSGEIQSWYSDSASLFVRDQLVAANTDLQKQLERAERQIKAQAEQIRARPSDARTDLLTNLANRRVFDDELNKRFSEWERTHTPFTLLILDIDHFKRFNDTHGHQAGDEVLRQVARILAKETREMDIVSRYGGEEFAVILPAISGFNACRVAERVRKAIERAETQVGEGCLTFTVSIGVADVAAPEQADELIRRADEALYASKQAGRNCVHWHNGESIASINQTAMTQLSADGMPGRAHSKTRLLSTIEFSRELARLVSASHLLARPLSLMRIKVEDGETLVRRHGEFAVGRFLDVAVNSLISAMCDADVLGQTALDELLVLFPGRSQVETLQLLKSMHFQVTNCTFTVADKGISARFRYEVCQLLPNETANQLLQRARNESIVIGAP